MSKGKHKQLIEQRIKNLWDQTDFTSTLFKRLTGYAIIAADFDGNIIAYNEGARIIYGYTPNQVVGKIKFDHLYRSEFIESGTLSLNINNLLEKETASFECEKMRKNGRIFPAHVLLSLTKDTNNHVVGFIEIVEDLTERNKKDAELGKYRERLEELVKERTAELSKEIAAHERSEAELEKKRQKLLEQTKIAADFLNILEITATSLNFDEAVNKLLPYIRNLLGCDYCLVYKTDEQSQTVKAISHYGLSEEDITYYATARATYAECVTDLKAKKEINFIEDMSSIHGEESNLCNLFKQIKVRSLIILPIVYQKKLAEILICVYLAKKVFSQPEKERVDKLQKHLEKAFIAQQNSVNLLTDTMQLAQQLEILRAMSDIDRTVLSSLNENEVIYGAMKTLGQAVSNDIIEVMNFNKKKNVFTLTAIQEGGRIVSSQKMKEPFSEDDMRCWDNVMLGMPTYYPDLPYQKINEKFEKRFSEKRYYSLLTMPLISKGNLIGLMTIGSKRKAAYTPQQLLVVQQLGNQMAVALSNTGLIRELKDLVIGVVNSLAAALDAKSAWTVGHSYRVSELAVAIGKSLGLDDDQLYNLKLAALFHDVGKIGTYDVILDKSGKLTYDEFELIKKHPIKTFEILKPIQSMKEIAEIAKHHHERYDGSGYPDGLSGENIPYLSRIIAAADTFDAMTSDRPYRKGLTKDQAIDEIKNLSGKQFDPEIAEVFIGVIIKEFGKSLKKAA